jgi:hypothetical protein
MSSQYTFWRLVEEFKIIVPIIQRDYAQGRKDDLKIAQIRKTFIQHLLEKINQNSHKSDLDFVYGSVLDEQLKLLDDFRKFYINGNSDHGDSKYHHHDLKTLSILIN